MHMEPISPNQSSSIIESSMKSKALDSPNMCPKLRYKHLPAFRPLLNDLKKAPNMHFIVTKVMHLIGSHWRGISCLSLGHLPDTSLAFSDWTGTETAFYPIGLTSMSSIWIAKWVTDWSNCTVFIFVVRAHIWYTHILLDISWHIYISEFCVSPEESHDTSHMLRTTIYPGND